MSIVQTINLNLIPNSGPILVKCDQYDVGEGRIVAKLYDGDTAYTPAAGATAIIQGKKPDGNGFMYDATLSGNTVTADLTNQMSVVAGRVCCQIVVTESDNRTGSFVFFLEVQKSALPDDTEMSASDYQVIEELLETAQAINENFPYIGANGHWWYYDVEQGEYVDSGVSAGTSITVGTTTTLPQGQDATVTNTGDNINAVFNFGIPRGEKGDDGEPGQDGADGVTPDISATATADALSSATPTVEVTKTGTTAAPSFKFEFSGLKGQQGEQGETGATGATGPAGNGIVSITKTGTSGLVDTYTILFTNGQSTTFTVTNGQDGTGSGDMTKAVYDSTNAVADAGGIAAYVAAHAATGDFVSLKGVTDISSWTELKTFNIGNYYYKGDASTKFSDAPSDIPSKNAMSLSMAVRRFDDSTNKVFQELVLGYTSSSPDEKYIRKFFRVGNRGLNDVWSDWKEVAYTDDIPDITGKADKVSGATSGDFAGLDASGNLTDSGSKASDFATAGSALPTGGTAGQFLRKSSGTNYDAAWSDDVFTIEDAKDAEIIPTKNICGASLVQGAIGTSGAYTSSTTRVCITDYIPVTAGQAYVVSVDTSLEGKTVQFNAHYYSAQSEESHTGYEPDWTVIGGSITIPSDTTAYMRFSLRTSDNSTVTPSDFSNLMVCTLADWNKSHEYEPYYVPVKDRFTGEKGTFTATVTGKGILTAAQYCIIDNICFVYVSVKTTDAWAVGDANIVLSTNLPTRSTLDFVFAGAIYGNITVNCYSHADGRISFHNISGTIPANTQLMASLSYPII